MFMYFLSPHWGPATWRSRAQTSIRAELPSGKLSATRVRRISRFSLSITGNGATLVLCCGKHFSRSLQHTKALVANDEFRAVQATAKQPQEEADPAGLAFLHTLCGAQNLTVWLTH